MKVAPVSGDLLVKLGLGLAVAGAAWYAIGKLRDSLPKLPDFTKIPAALWNSTTAAVATALPYVNPADARNVANATANAGVSAATGRDETVGGLLWSWTNPDPMASWNLPPKNTGGATGSWDTATPAWDSATGTQPP